MLQISTVRAVSMATATRALVYVDQAGRACIAMKVSSFNTALDIIL